MLRTRATVLVVTVLAVAPVLTAPLGASTPTGLEGHRLVFTVHSKKSETACVSYYETTKKRGPAKHLDRVSNELVELPWRARSGTGAKVRHWRIIAWATDDCTSTADPKGALTCTIEVDGERKVRARGADQIVFCDI